MDFYVIGTVVACKYFGFCRDGPGEADGRRTIGPFGDAVELLRKIDLLLIVVITEPPCYPVAA